VEESSWEDRETSGPVYFERKKFAFILNYKIATLFSINYVFSSFVIKNENRL
jgi:hypothetical protein